MTIQEMIHGTNAFYKQPDYFKKTAAELHAKEAPTPSRIIQVESKVMLLAKEALFLLGRLFIAYITLQTVASLLGIFQWLRNTALIPLALKVSLVVYTLLEWIHRLAGLVIVPSSVDTKESHQFRELIDIKALDKLGYRIKRFSIEVDGRLVDAIMLGRPKNLKNGRWMLVSGGNGEQYEHIADTNVRNSLLSFLDALETNAILFNYPGVGASSGFVTKNDMIKAYEGLLRVLEQDVKAKELFGYGHSIGGGVQAEALNSHQFARGIQYLFIKSRTFAKLSSTAANLLFRPLDLLIRLIRWEFNTVASSRNLHRPEIILQTSHKFQDLTKNLGGIIGDGIIAKTVSLGEALLDEAITWKNKCFIGIPERHNEGFPTNSPQIAEKIRELLS